MSTKGVDRKKDRDEIAASRYALLTRDIGSGISGPRADSSGGTRGGALGPVAIQALQDVLGWKINAGDSKGFKNALNQAFELTMVEGVVQSKWTPRSYAVQTDLSGGISGAQASLYTMAKNLLDQTLPLLAGLSPLKPDPKADYIEAVKHLARSQMTELVGELGKLGGPRLVRVDQYFRMLIGSDSSGAIIANPDLVKGTLGSLRDEMGLRATKSSNKPSYVNRVSDEQNVTNFRVIVDYVNAILQSWKNSINFFGKMESQFLGTQLVWISRQLGVVNEAVEEVRFMMDSVFVGPAERETFWLKGLKDEKGQKLTAITLEALLSWIQSFVTNEGPDIIQAGGKFGIGEDFLKMVRQLHRYVQALAKFAAAHSDEAISTERVKAALKKLAKQLNELHEIAKKVEITKLP